MQMVLFLTHGGFGYQGIIMTRMVSKMRMENGHTRTTSTIYKVCMTTLLRIGVRTLDRMIFLGMMSGCGGICLQQVRMGIPTRIIPIYFSLLAVFYRLLLWC